MDKRRKLRERERERDRDRRMERHRKRDNRRSSDIGSTKAHEINLEFKLRMFGFV